MRGTYPVVLSFGCLLAAVAVAQPVDSAAQSQGEIQLAQFYDFQVYIDAYGREVVIDPRTNRVVEIREPAYEPPVPEWEPDRDWYERERDRTYYDFTDPRDVERFHREREAAIYGRDRRNSREPEPAYPGRRGAATPGARGNSDGGSIYRAPLEPPSPDRNRSVVAVPQTGEGTSVSPQTPGTTVNPNADITIPSARGATEEVAKFQILLDRVGASPGVIDGRMGDNVNKAISAYYEITGQRLRTYDKEWIEAELERTGGPAFIEYTITSEDAAGPFIASVPADYGEKAKLEWLGYTRVSEMLAERFHMDEKYLLALNPGVNFDRPGTIVKVANTNTELKYEVGRIVADKTKKQLRVYDTRGRLVASYPATIGSDSTPSPTGTHTIERIVFNPEYTYNPKINFKQGNNDKVLRIPPGPNGPVGSVWIALSKPTYGIHGTPDPEKIGKTYSNGCIRLTNWDAEELAKRVTKGVTVEFI